MYFIVYTVKVFLMAHERRTIRIYLNVVLFSFFEEHLPNDDYEPFAIYTSYLEKIALLIRFLKSHQPLRLSKITPSGLLYIYEYYLLYYSRSLGPADDLDVTRIRATAQYYDVPEST